MNILTILVAESGDRPVLERCFPPESGIVVVGTACSGQQVVTLTKRRLPAAVVIDASLSEFDAFDVARRIMSEVPTALIIAIDPHDSDAVSASTEAMRGGALLVVNKPNPGTATYAQTVAALVGAVRTMAGVKLVRRRGGATASAVALPVVPPGPPQVVAIGASTGGPPALQHVLKTLPADYALPILVTQHISPGFSSGMVRWLDSTCAINVKIAQNGEPLRASTVYVADDDRHLTVGRDRTIALISSPAVNGHRPSASVLFQSVAEVYGSRSLAVILTGMGND
ncbi:MAG: chemotaxis protein CheB, partial [Vulcanimicrobiaceae bacterium]